MPMSRARRMRRRSVGRSAYQPASPLPVTPKRSTLASVTCRSAFNHAGTRFAEGVEPAPTGGQGHRDQSPWPFRFASLARHCSVENAAVIVLDHGLRAGTVRAPITANFRWWAEARPLGHRLGVRRRALHLDHPEYFDLCWVASTAVRVDDLPERCCVL